MISNFNLFSYDRLLMIMTFRSFDSVDSQLSLDILNMLMFNSDDFRAKFNDYITVNSLYFIFSYLVGIHFNLN